MPIKEVDLKSLLVKEHYVTEEDMKNAEEHAKKTNGSFVESLISQDLLSDRLLGQAQAEYYKTGFSDLESAPPGQKDLEKLPREVSVGKRIVFVGEDKGVSVFATDDPSRPGLNALIKKSFPKARIKINFALPHSLDSVLSHYRKPLATRFSKIIAAKSHIAPEIIDEILSEAVSFRASDVHFEPRGGETVVRFRVDGVLQEAGTIPKEYYGNILNRIKVQGKLRIDEHLAAQDGAMRQEIGERAVDFRISVVPVVEGEKVVLRIMASYVKGIALTDLGFEPNDQTLLEAAAEKPYGMILVVGPTGSGKTTTLYSVLRLLNKPEVNITTIEDPVEYKVAGINQIQVNTQTGLTFAKGLRSIVRQDPDVIMVGEIRDLETAEIAVNAALTGHLLLSTFHANDAATVIPRLLDMGIEPFLLASTLDVIVAQRLVRKICENCRYSTTIEREKLLLPGKLASKFFKNKTCTVYQGKGCAVCSNSGFRGRTAVFEIIRMTPELQDLVVKSPSSKDIWSLARKQGSVSLFEDGLNKVKNGVTTIAELMRVAELKADEK